MLDRHPDGGLSTRNYPPFFVDDSLIFMKVAEEAARTIKELLESYEKASGQQINFQTPLLCLKRIYQVLMQRPFN